VIQFACGASYGIGASAIRASRRNDGERKKDGEARGVAKNFSRTDHVDKPPLRRKSGQRESVAEGEPGATLALETRRDRSRAASGVTGGRS
jgi:hypothetical protein